MPGERAGEHQCSSQPTTPGSLPWPGAPELGPVGQTGIEIDIEQCPECGGTLTILAAIEDPPVIAKMLTHHARTAAAP